MNNSDVVHVRLTPLEKEIIRTIQEMNKRPGLRVSVVGAIHIALAEWQEKQAEKMPALPMPADES
jgi:hypothetical protein